MAGVLRVHPKNPRYFTDDSGKAIYLTGSHIWNNVQGTKITEGVEKPQDLDSYIPWLKELNHNFQRLWVAEEATSVPNIWKKVGDKFDLTCVSEEYLSQLYDRMKRFQDNGIYTSVMFFQQWSTEHERFWSIHPFNKENNIQGFGANFSDGKLGNDFHRLGNKTLTKYQKLYIQQVIDKLNDLDGFFYEICNEGASKDGSQRPWQTELTKFIKKTEKKKPKQHLVCISGYRMTEEWEWELQSEMEKSPADIIAPGGSFPRFMENIQPASGKKIIMPDTDHIWGIGGGDSWVWKNLASGNHPIFMDDLKERQENGRKAMGHALQYANRMNLAQTKPSPELSATGYCLANPGEEYLIYSENMNEFKVEIEKGTYQVEWFNLAEAKAVPGENVTAAKKVAMNFKAPFQGQAVLFLQK
jgi:hypothetical protein